MILRRAFVWMLLLALAATVVGGAYLGWSLARANETIREKILAVFAEKMPNWEVTIDRCDFDWNRTVRVFGSTVRLEGDDRDIVELPEIVVTLDREKFDRNGEVVLTRVRLVRPRVHLRREVDGGWNWQRLLPPESKERASLPEWLVEDASVAVHLGHENGSDTTLPAATVNGRVVPSGKRRFEVVGRVDVEGTGAFDLDGELDVDRNTWSFGGRAVDLVSGGELVDLAARVMPETETRIAEFDERMQGWLPEGNRDGVRVADNSNDPNIARMIAETRRVPDDARPLGIDGHLAIEFRLEQPPNRQPVEFSVSAEFNGAQFDHPALPFPLHDVDGRVVWGNDRFAVENLSARNGVTTITASGNLEQGTETAGEFAIDLRDVVLDERLRSRLTGRIRAVYDSFRPTGRADFHTRIVVEDGSARPEGLELHVKEAEATYAAFPYQVERVNGSLRQVGKDLKIEVDGYGGRVPVKLAGMVRDFAGEAEASFAITGEELPIDRAFLQACPPPVRSALEAMRLEGRTDVAMNFLRPAGRDSKWKGRLEAKLSEGAIEFSGFPYRVTELGGTLMATTHDGIWRFQDLAGVHDEARLTATGSFVQPKRDEPARLRMRIITRDAALDRQLRFALTESMRDVWNSVEPTGKLNTVCDIDWTPGEDVDLRFPVVEISEGTIRPRALPLRFSDVSLKGAYAEGRFDVEKFSARHGDSRFRSTGFVQVEEEGGWRLRFDDLIVDDLDAGPELRNVLPQTLAEMHETIDLRGNLSVSGRAEFRGTDEADGTVTAAWELDTVLSGNEFFAGIQLENVHGSLTSKGTYDGQQTVAVGELDLDSVAGLGYQFTQVKGPYEVDGRQLLLGSRKAFEEEIPPIKLEERITAKAIEGTFVMDGIVVTGEDLTYNLKFLLSDGRLESYAERYMPGTKNLSGVMNGWLSLYGRGNTADDVQGRGQLQVSPAALYELPLVVKLLNTLPFTPPNRAAAFDYARLDFRIARQRFAFDAIDLVGDSLSLRGRGTVGFDQSVNLDFYSQQPRSQLAIPVVRLIVGEAAKGLVAIYVRGRLDQPGGPNTQVVTAPTVDAALKTFLGRLVRPTERSGRTRAMPIRGTGRSNRR